MPVRTRPGAASPRHLTDNDICTIERELAALPATWFYADVGEGKDDAFNYMHIAQYEGPALAEAFTIDKDADGYTLRCITNEGLETTLATVDTAEGAVWSLWIFVSSRLRKWSLRVM